MKKFRIGIICALVFALTLGLTSALGEESSAFPSERDAFKSSFYIGETDQERPFFDVVLPEIVANIEENNTHSITPYYDALPRANNPENFQGLGTATYENVNGKTVTAEALFRVAGESLSDPNLGMGLMIFQCIQYKLKHPEEDVKITFSSYRTSVTASVCVIPGSRYYGYMRSLYGTNYDEHGFVRISFMLAEAARMGIEVTMVNQLTSYGVQQYNPSKGKREYRTHLDYKPYFKAALETDCYEKYAAGKKVSDFLTCTTVGWTVGDQTANMQHVKSASVSHYLATDGTEHGPAVFFCSANLDENNYKGQNGNNGAQSGVIISDHDDLYRVTYNYTMLMNKYSHQEGLQELRYVMNKLNNEQTELILSGRGSEIPRDEQIVYLGSETDKIFELYFTPLGGSVDTWDTVHNPVCKYIDKLPLSTDYIEFIWNEYGFGNDYVTYTFKKMLDEAFCNNPNPNNKISTRAPEFYGTNILKLKLGTEIGYRSIKSVYDQHTKDFLMSYEEDGQRHYVSIISSANFYMIAFNYRTNSILVIHETEETGDGFYKAFGTKYSYGMFD